MLVDLGGADINKCLYTKVVMILNTAGLCKSLKFFQGYCKLFIVTKIKMSVQQIMQSLYIVACFYPYHQRVRPEKLHPFLSVAVVLQKVLADKCVSAIA